MKPTILTLLLATFIFTNSLAQTEHGTSDLTGSWTVDLRPTPLSDAYLQTFKIDKIAGDSFEGSFYDSRAVDGLIKLENGRTLLAFKTNDQSNTYYHFVKIIDDKIEGISYSYDRKLIQPWFGRKE